MTAPAASVGPPVRGARALLWLRWSWRDLRARWLQVAAIALIIAIGSGTYSGLTSVSAWRQASYDASYAALNMYDLRLELTTGSYAGAHQLVEVARSIPHAPTSSTSKPASRSPSRSTRRPPTSWCWSLVASSAWTCGMAARR